MLIRAAALIHISHNFGHNLLSKLLLLFELQLLFEGSSYYRIYGNQSAYLIMRQRKKPLAAEIIRTLITIISRPKTSIFAKQQDITAK